MKGFTGGGGGSMWMCYLSKSRNTTRGITPLQINDGSKEESKEAKKRERKGTKKREAGKEMGINERKTKEDNENIEEQRETNERRIEKLYLTSSC